MTEAEQSHFERTINRIADNLSVQRNARDLELYTKTCEVREYVTHFQTDYGGGGMGEYGGI